MFHLKNKINYDKTSLKISDKDSLDRNQNSFLKYAQISKGKLEKELKEFRNMMYIQEETLYNGKIIKMYQTLELKI